MASPASHSHAELFIHLLRSVCIAGKINKAYRMLWLIKRNFYEIGNGAFILLCKHLVRVHLEYNNSVSAPCKRYDIEKLEKVQKRATKMLPGLRKMPYPERLKKIRIANTYI